MSRLSLLVAQACDWRRMRSDCVFLDRVRSAVCMPVADPHLAGAF